MPAPALKYFLHTLLFACFLCFAPGNIYAQKSIWEGSQKTKEGIQKKSGKAAGSIRNLKEHISLWGLDSNYRQGIFIGGRLYTNGWSGSLVWQKKMRPGVSHYFQLSFSEIRHEKQVKQQGQKTAFPELGNSSPFVFGKINNLYLAQIGHGREQLLLPGVLDGNISVSFRYNAGFSLALLKPYYLRLIHVDYTPEQVVWLQEEKYGDANADLFLKKDNILGASKWSKGLNDMSYVPGAYAEAAFAIEPAKGKALIQTILLGTNFSVYGKKLPVMAERTAYPWQASLFVGLMIGKKWR
jgi:hypothetical protein